MLKRSLLLVGLSCLFTAYSCSAAMLPATNHTLTAGKKTPSASLAERLRGLIGNVADMLTHRLPPPEFMMEAPSFDKSPPPKNQAKVAAQKFARAQASCLSPTQLVRAGVFSYAPLHGGIYARRQKISHIIMHSTETVYPADALQIIHSWNERGLRHAGAQFIVNRTGVIYMTLDPSLACVHVEPTRTLFGVNNDNSVGVEIVHTGDQHYTAAQLASVERLVLYLQQRFHVARSEVLAHATVQPSDRRDPVDFNWRGFWLAETQLSTQHNTAGLAQKTATVAQKTATVAHTTAALTQRNPRG